MYRSGWYFASLVVSCGQRYLRANSSEFELEFAALSNGESRR
jgi:hypothetical protein